MSMQPTPDQIKEERDRYYDALQGTNDDFAFLQRKANKVAVAARQFLNLPTLKNRLALSDAVAGYHCSIGIDERGESEEVSSDN